MLVGGGPELNGMTPAAKPPGRAPIPFVHTILVVGEVR
jgi:hypothetical protein